MAVKSSKNKKNNSNKKNSKKKNNSKVVNNNKKNNINNTNNTNRDSSKTKNEKVVKDKIVTSDDILEKEVVDNEEISISDDLELDKEENIYKNDDFAVLNNNLDNEDKEKSLNDENDDKDKSSDSDNLELKEVNSKKKFNKRIICFFMCILFCFVVMLYLCIPKIDLLGEDVEIVKYYDEYKELGYSANILWFDVSDRVKINSNLVNGQVGNYKIEYLIDYGFIDVKKERYINVIDDKEPVININTDVIKICPNQEIPKLEYSVIDEYDGDITSNTLEEINDNKIKLVGRDLSGNEIVKEINIDRSDDVKPVISLRGYSTVYLVVGEGYVESGYSASDNCDGDLTSKVMVSGSIGQSVGNYKLVYTVTDSSGNKSEVYREVIVINKYISNNGSASNGSVYLTFDDGPNEGTTNVILDILRDEGVKATFFVTSRGPDYLIKRMYDEGHTVALHTAGHDYAYIYSSIDNYFNDLNTISNRVERITGEKSMIIRFPGGSSNAVSRNYKVGIMTSLSKLVLSKGYRYYDWNIDSMDASSAYSSQAVYNNVVNHLSKNRVNMVLMHDTKAITRDAIRNIIRYGKSQGYNFEKIDMSTYMIRHGIIN